MKKQIIILAIITSAIMAVAGTYSWTGAGKVVSVTTTPQVVLVPSTNYAYSVSVFNAGSDTLYFNKNTTTNGFVATNCIPVPSGASYTTAGASGNNEAKSRSISSIVIGTASGTAMAYVAFE